MDYKQKYLKYKQKYLKMLRDQKGGEPFLSDILLQAAYLWLFNKNQRQLVYIFNQRQLSYIFLQRPISLRPLENIRLNDKHRLSLMAKSGLSLRLASLLVEDQDRNLMYHLAKRIISRLHDKLLQLTPTPTCVATLHRRNGGHNNMVNCVAFHGSLRLMATGSLDETVKLWRLVDTPGGMTVTCMATLDQSNRGHWGSINCVAFHPSAPLLATGSDDKTVKLWRFNPDGTAATCVGTLDQSNMGHSSYITSIVFHTSLPLMATCSNDKTVKLWRFEPNGAALTYVVTLKGYSRTVTCATFHASAPLLATGSNDNTVKLWRFNPDGTAATCVSTLDQSNGGHNSLVSSIAFHASSNLLATGSNDNTVKLWRVSPDGTASTCVATLDQSNGAHNPIICVAFHASLPILATSSADNTTKCGVWMIPKR